MGSDRVLGHDEDGSDELRVPRWAKVLTSVLAVLLAGAMAFAFFQPVKVLPRLRPAPGYALVDERGERVTSEDGRGMVTLYTFTPLDCGAACEEVDETMREVRDRVADEVDLAGMPFRLVTIVLDADPTTEELVAAAQRAGDVGDPAGDDWVWLGGSQSQVDNVVGGGFRRRTDVDGFTPSYAIVDGFGTIRGEYRYQTLADDADKLVRHVGVLGSELRNASGFGSLAYEAAHLFQCYP